MKAKIIDLSILLPTYNRPEMVGECVSSIAKQDRPPREIIVLDQGRLSRALIEKYKQALKPTKLVYKHLRIRGRTRAINVGVKMAKSELIAVIDDDCYAHSKWTYYLIKTIRSKKKRLLLVGFYRGN